MPEAQTVIEALESHYRSGKNDLRADFFEPCIEHCASYDRAAGYFSSSALSSWCGILPQLVSGAATGIRLLVSPDLNEEDKSLLQSVADPVERSRLRQNLSDNFIFEVLSLDSGELPTEVRLQLLAWLIANDKLEIRFAFPDHVDSPGIYHEKIGLFTFPWGEQLAFTGSANETYSGHRRNWESVDVFRSWISKDSERVNAKQLQFLEAWMGDAPGLEILSLSPSTIDRIRDVSPDVLPSTGLQNHDQPSFQLFGHQEAALSAWRDNDCSGLLEMCTGSGKTITAIEATTWLSQQPTSDSGTGTLLIVACPRKVLVDQWDAEIAKWRPDWLRLKAYDSIASWSQNLRSWLKRSDGRTYVIIATYSTLLTPACVSQLKRADLSHGHSIFVADEAHHLGSSTRLKIVEDLLPIFESRLALTATPEVEGHPERTRRLTGVFGGSVFEFTLNQAIDAGVLCPYYYYPRPTFLDADVSAEYLAITTELESSEARNQVELYRRKRELLRTSGAYLTEFERLLDECGSAGVPLDHTVVYSPPGSEGKDSDERIIAKVKQALSDRHILVASITAATPQNDRKELLEGFRNRKFQVLLGIGCLDEGLDIPETQRAVVLYSFDRMKQFIQRRGRVLRRATGKEAASIHDLILLPQGSDLPESTRQRIFDRELRRYREFAGSSLNPEEANAILDNALDQF